MKTQGIMPRSKALHYAAKIVLFHYDKDKFSWEEYATHPYKHGGKNVWLNRIAKH